MDIYRQETLDHARNPRKWGLLKHRDIRGSEVNTSCGDEVTIDLRLKPNGIGSPAGIRSRRDQPLNRPIKSSGFEGSGCIVMLASADMLAEHIQGKTIHDIMAMSDQKIFDFFGGKLTPSRQTCALLPLIALKKGIAQEHYGI